MTGDANMVYRAATNFTIDQLGFIQLAGTDVLAAAARGEIDINTLVREELASRGMDNNAKWVGFKQAEANV
jgi:hypothetical protein